MNNPNQFNEFVVGNLLLEVGKKYHVHNADITFRRPCTLKSIIKRDDEIHIGVYCPFYRTIFNHLVVQWEIPKLGKSLTTLTPLTGEL